MKSTAIYKKTRSAYHRFRFLWRVNWTKTLYFNLKKFPFSVAKKLPVFFYGKAKFGSITGKIVIDAPIEMGMIGFGMPYEMTNVAKGTTELVFSGTLVFKGYVQFGKDFFLYVKNDAYCEFGNMAGMGSRGQIICTHKILFGNYARMGSECRVLDTNFHEMVDTETQERQKMTGMVSIGSYNYIGSRIIISKDTKTPDYCTIASSSLCNKDYTDWGKNILMGGVPAKILKKNIARDWEKEEPMMKRSLIFLNRLRQ